VDSYSDKSGKHVLIQIGVSQYLPKHAEYFRFRTHNELIKLIKSAELVITQGGYGSIYDCLNQKKKVIAVPRKKDMQESSDSGLGQIELVRYLEKQGRILALYDLSRLEETIHKAHSFEPNFDYSNNVSKVISTILAKERQKQRKSNGINIFRNIFPLFFKNRIIEMTAFVTDKCNFRCKHCFMLDTLNKKKDNFLSLEEFRLMGKHIHSMQRVHIGGGEPLIRKDISDVVLTISNHWNTQVICLPTNGSFQENAEHTAEEFGLKGRHHLRFHFSLSVVGEQMTDFTGHKQAFHLWEKTIKSVKKITREFKNVSTIVLSTFNDYNQNHIEDFIRYITNDVVPDDFSFALVRSHANYKPNLNLNKFISINHKIHCESRAHNPFIRAYRELIRNKISQYYKDPRYTLKCTSGTLRVVMSPDGDVYPCERLGYPEGSDKDEWNMGNIREHEYNIHKLLRGAKAKSIQKRIRDDKCHCQQAIDMSINYLCTWKFKFEVLFLGAKYLFRLE
jgi:radical SAM protein with 4Fe4S-binding SPASM domain